MTVFDFVNLCTETMMLNVDVYESKANEIVWSGQAKNIPFNIKRKELLSFDAQIEEPKITLNV